MEAGSSASQGLQLCLRRLRLMKLCLSKPAPRNLPPPREKHWLFSCKRWTGCLLRRKCLEDFLRKRRSEEHTSELQSHSDLVCRLLLEKKKHVRRPAECLTPPLQRPWRTAGALPVGHQCAACD